MYMYIHYTTNLVCAGSVNTPEIRHQTLTAVVNVSHLKGGPAAQSQARVGQVCRILSLLYLQPYATEIQKLHMEKSTLNV